MMHSYTVNYKYFFARRKGPTQANVSGAQRFIMPLNQPHLLQEPAVAVASGRPAPVPRDLGEAGAAPGLFLPRGPQPRLHLAPQPPNCPAPFFPKPSQLAGNPPLTPSLGSHKSREQGEVCKFEIRGRSLVLMLTLKIALCFHWVPAESQPCEHLSLVRGFPNVIS